MRNSLKSPCIILKLQKGPCIIGNCKKAQGFFAVLEIMCDAQGLLQEHEVAAAIKVDKKQIHLGTVGSQKEAARLYDRAAFMCGREPNFELTEEAKEELRKLTWEDFLEMTRNNINNKKQQRKFGGPRRKKMEMEVQSDMGGSSQSDGTDPDALAS